MAVYYNIPAEAQNALQVIREAALARDTDAYNEALLLYLGGRRDLLKLVIDREVGRDYSGHTVLYRVRLDPASPETWEAQVGQLLDRVSLLPTPDSDRETSSTVTTIERPDTVRQDQTEKIIGVLFDIDGLGGPSSYGTPCWRILMKNLDLRKMPGVLFYQGDLDIKASQRPYCYCIAISELEALTGGRGSQYFKQKLSSASDAGLFPPDQRFIEGNVTASLIGSGRVDIDGRFRMSSNLGDLGDLRLVTNGRDFGWTVLPDDDLLALFALTYLRKTGGEGIPLGDESRELCESVLRDVGHRPTIVAIRAAGLPSDHLKLACDRLILQVWPDVPKDELEIVATKKWWEFWK